MATGGQFYWPSVGIFVAAYGQFFMAANTLPPDLAGEPSDDGDESEPLPAGQGRRGRASDKALAHLMLLLRGGDMLTRRAADRLEEVFSADDPTDTLQAVWKVKEQLMTLLRTGSFEDAAAAKAELEKLVKAAARPETNRLYHTVCRWWKEIEVLITTGATTGKVEANNTAIKNIKRTARGYRNSANYKSVILLRSAVRMGHGAHAKHSFPHEP